MANTAGTIESIALTMGKAMVGLDGFFQPDLFKRLGVELPAVIATDPGIAAKLTECSTKIKELPPKVTSLQSAVTGGDALAMLAASASLLTTVGQAVVKFKELGSAVTTASNPLPASDKAAIQALATKLAIRLVEYGVVGILNDQLPLLIKSLSVIGIVDKETLFPSGRDVHSPVTEIVQRRIYFSRLTNLLSNPVGYMKDSFDWGNPGFTGTALFKKIQSLLESAGFPADIYKIGSGPLTLEAYLFTLELDTSTVPPGIKLSFNATSDNDFSRSYLLRDPWSGTVALKTAFDAGLIAQFRPPLSVNVKPPTGNFTIGFSAGIKAEKASQDPLIIFGETGGSRLQTKSIAASIGIDANTGTGGGSISPSFEFDIKEGKLIIDTSKGDG
ncbi:MAG: hypothetical protein KGO82_17670, partial [Bacteroidota bacterium]|nr:hypothetical protein [Bacteroidota bacterium]